MSLAINNALHSFYCPKFVEDEKRVNAMLSTSIDTGSVLLPDITWIGRYAR